MQTKVDSTTSRALVKADAADEIDARMRAMGTVFQRTDRIISGDSALSVSVVKAEAVEGLGLGDVAGWTDGQDISINSTVIARLLRSAKTERKQAEIVASIYGVNLHELAHNIFTPRVDEGLSKRIQPFGDFAWQVYNILEDQRAEGLFAGLYAPAATHFKRVALTQILDRNDETQRDTLWFLFYSRPWIPADLVASLRKRFDANTPGAADQVAPLMDEYMSLVFPTDDTRGYEIIMAIVSILQPVGCTLPDGNHGEQARGTADEDKQNEAQEARPVSEPGSGEFDEDETGDDDGPGESEDDETGDAAGGAGTDEDEPTGSAPDGDASEPETGTEQAPGGAEQDADSHASDDSQGEGTGDQTDDGSEANERELDVAEIEALDQAIDSAAADALDDHDGSDEWQEERKLIDRSMSRELDKITTGVARGKRLGGRARPVTPEMRVQLRKVQRAFDDLRAQLEAAWVSQEPQGRLNVLDYINADHGDFDVFDRYDEGNEDQSGVEIVLLIDRSSSMSDRSMNQVSQAVWVIRQAIERLDGRVTVLAYDHRHFVCSDAGERVSSSTYPAYSAEGATSPGLTLLEARRILKGSDRPNRLLVTLTDGGWTTYANFGNSTVDTDGVIATMNREGIVTALFGTCAYTVKSYGAHGCLVGHDLLSINDLPLAVERLVAESIKRQSIGV